MTDTRPTALILGANSDIGRAIARDYAKAGYDLILAARDISRLAEDPADLLTRSGAKARLLELDLLDEGGRSSFPEAVGVVPDVVVCVVGLLGDQKVSERDGAAAERVMRTNYLAPALLLDALAVKMEERGSGTIIGISSVAGDRGRASNYIYGSAKAGFTAFLSGLRNRLAAKGVSVITVKPGFVDTSMTAGMELPPLLTAQPEEVARAVLRAQETGRNSIYVRPIWRLIMLIIRHIPESIFKKLKL